MTKLVNVLRKPVVAAAVLGFAITSGVASADFNPKFYVGAGVDYAKYSINKTEGEVLSAGETVKSKGMGLLVPVLGVKFHDNFGVEFGYSFNRKIKINGTTTASVKYPEEYKVRNGYVDLMGYLPVMDQFDLIGGVGIGRLMVKKGQNVDGNNGSGTIDVKNKFGWRVKAGAQYNITSNVGVRALVTYQNTGTKLKNNSTNKDYKFVKNLTSFGLAATYTF